MTALSQFRTRTRYYLDDGSATRWVDAEVDYYINDAYEYYYNKLVNVAYNGLLKDTPASLDIVAATDTVAVPADFYKGKRLYRVLSSRKVPLQNRENYEDTVYTGGAGGEFFPVYEFRATDILLMSTPQSSHTGGLELDYWPVMTALTLDTDEPVSGFSEQWQKLIPLRAAWIAKALREEEDVSNLITLLDNKEGPFNDTIDSMTIARQYTQPFFTGGS